MHPKYLRGLLTVVLMVVAGILAGCGGGGGGSSSSSSTRPVSNSISLTLTDLVTGESISNIPVGGAARLTATVLGESRRPVANAVVTFSVPSMLTMTPASGTALSNSSGVVSVVVQPAATTSQGAGTITAAALAGAVEVKGSVNFSVSLPDIRLANLLVSPNPLSAYGTASIVVDVTGLASAASVPVYFTSFCAQAARATLPASVMTVNGRATASYTDRGCGASDTITVSLANGVTLTKTLTVSPPSAASIQTVSVTPTSIVLKGTGGIGLQETSVVKFKVVDATGNPVANASVLLDLTTRVGGILLEGGNTSVTRLTNALGEVQVTVQSGTVPTSVWVTASVDLGGRTLTTQSTTLTISTGKPAQDRFSLAVETLNIEGWAVNGMTTNLIVHASDRLGNPAPDGTTVNFISNGGQITPTCTIAAGTCSATFTSANPRPVGNTEPVLGISAGRAVILAYAIGEESFTDRNGNNAYDAGEPFNDLGNAFLDANQNGTLDPGEQVVIFNSGSAACRRDITTSPVAPSATGSCDGVWGFAHVRQDTVVVMSGSRALINDVVPVAGYTPNTTFSMGGTCQATVSFFLFDENRNPMPKDTKLTAGTPPTDITATIIGDTVPNTSAPGGTSHSISIVAANTMCVGGALAAPVTVPIIVETPRKAQTTINLRFTP